jgi:hypothetical protein
MDRTGRRGETGEREREMRERKEREMWQSTEAAGTGPRVCRVSGEE